MVRSFTIVNVKIILTLIIATAAFITDCIMPGKNSESGQKQGIHGTVLFQRHNDASLLPHEPDPPPSPLPGAKIYLLNYHKGDLGRNDILDSAITDSLGCFEINYAPGTYFLAISKTSLVTVELIGTASGSMKFDVPINAMNVIEILPSKFTEKTITLHEITPQ